VSAADTYYKLPGVVKRYVITHVGNNDLRRLTFAQQGRFTYETQAEAEETLAAFTGPQGFARVLSASELASLEVRPCPCWPGHFDPCVYYLD
jgi:hypothetical protein